LVEEFGEFLMGRAYVKKRIKRLKELADKQDDADSKELMLVFYDVFKFLVERAVPRGTEPDEGDEDEK
jgi:hypothetical protein